jgi:phage protein D
MNSKLVPEIQILLEGQKLQDGLTSKVTSAKINYCLEKSDMLQLTFSDDNFEIQNSGMFTHGKEIVVKLGYSQKFTKMIEAEIVRVDLDYETEAATTITVIGFDKMFRLNRTKHSRSFLKMKDSDIASKIASEMGLKAEVDSTSVKHDYIFQNNQSNLNFLKQRARRIDYEVEVVDKSLVFKKSRHEQREKSVKLVWDRNLIAFHPKLDASKIADEIEVTGWNPKTKELIKATAKAGDEKKSIKGESGSSKLKGKFKSSTSKSFKVDSPVSSLEEAKEIAKARLNQLNMEYITGYGVAIGEPKVVAGKLIEIDGVGDMVSGEYYITGCEHIYSSRGFKTYFDFKRGVEGAK